MTIVRIPHSVKFYPPRRLPPTVRAALEDIVASDPKTFHPKLGHKTLVGLMECYLDLRSEDLTVRDLKDTDSDQLLAGFIGALRSERFMTGVGKTARFNYVALFRNLLTAIRTRPLSSQLKDNEACDYAWSIAPLDPLAIEYWRGWYSEGPKGSLLSLHLVWHQLGTTFCEDTHAALVNYWTGRKKSVSNSISIFNHLFEYIRNHEPEVTAKSFSNATSFQKLIKNFGIHYFTSSQRCGKDIAVCRKRWEDWRYAVENALCNGQTWVKAKLPTAGSHRKSGTDNWINTNTEGIQVREKFLIDIPLGITDKDALSGIIKSIDKSISSVTAWATEKSNEIIKAYQRAQELKTSGVDLLTNGRIVGNHRIISEADLAATFAANSFDLFQREANFIGVRNISANKAAEILGIPIWNSLDPFIYLLINEHQEITEAFIRSVNLFDKNGEPSCLKKTDDGHILIGYKERRGSLKAEQKILLNSRSLAIIEQIILLTEPLRAWMKSNDIPGWNKLLLSCSKGLSRPSPMLPATYKHRASRARLFKSIVQFLGPSITDQDQFCQRLTYTTFRATRAIQLYFADGDEIALALRLGHARHSEELIKHYLPKELRSLMQERRITIIQTLIVATALEGSPLQESASGFKSHESLKDFLKLHKLHKMESEPANSMKDSETSELLLNLDPKILSTLAAITIASNNNIAIREHLKGWVTYAHLLFKSAKQQTRNTLLQSRIQDAIAEGGTEYYAKLVTA